MKDSQKETVYQIKKYQTENHKPIMRELTQKEIELLIRTNNYFKPEKITTTEKIFLGIGIAFAVFCFSAQVYFVDFTKYNGW